MDGEEEIQRVRRICLALPGATEKLSHGEPTFFVKKRVFAMVSNNHHNDGHVAVWIPAQPGEQEARPPYVGVKGWVGIELGRIGNEELAEHIAACRKKWRTQSCVPRSQSCERLGGGSSESSVGTSADAARTKSACATKTVAPRKETKT